MIGKSRLGERVKEMSAKTFRILGTAEGKIHGVAADHVHFHEVGAVDSIVDIVGGAAALEALGFPPLFHRPFRLGCGFIEIAHGRYPIPAPATIEILTGRTVILEQRRGRGRHADGSRAHEGARARSSPSSRSFVPRGIVYAAGTREEGPAPGMLRLIEAEAQTFTGEVTVLRTTIDDMNPEIIRLGDGTSLRGRGARRIPHADHHEEGASGRSPHRSLRRRRDGTRSSISYSGRRPLSASG